MRSSYHHLSTFYHSQVEYCSPNCEFGSVGTENGIFVKSEGSVILLALKLSKISNMLSSLNTSIKSMEYTQGKKKKGPYRQTAEQNMIKLLIDFCALCSKTDNLAMEKIKTKRNNAQIKSAKNSFCHIPLKSFFGIYWFIDNTLPSTKHLRAVALIKSNH